MRKKTAYSIQSLKAFKSTQTERAERNGVGINLLKFRSYQNGTLVNNVGEQSQLNFEHVSVADRLELFMK